MAKKLNNDKLSFEVDLRTKRAQEEIHKLTKATEELRKQNAQHRKALSELAQAEADTRERAENLKEQIAENTKEIEANSKKIGGWEEKIGNSGLTLAQLEKKLKQATRELKNTSKAADPQRYKELEDKIKGCNEAIANLKNVSKGFFATLMSFKKIKTVIEGFFLEIGAKILNSIVGTFKEGIQTIIDFEKANSNLAAVLGTTKANIKDLTDEARRLGATTSYTASQVTQLQTELAKLGFAKGDIISMEEGVLKFAQSVGTDLGSAAAFAGASMRIFGIEAQNVEGMLASLAIGTTKSALSFDYLQGAMATIGPVANSFGFSIEETIALLGQLANAGFDSSTAATATRNILLNLADANGKLATALGAPVNNLDSLVAGLNKLAAEGVDLAGVLELTDKRSVAAFSKFMQGGRGREKTSASHHECRKNCVLL